MQKLQKVKLFGQVFEQDGKFNKLKFLTVLGHINSRFNYETRQFEKSWPLRVNFYFMMLIKASFPFRFWLTYQFEREDPRQLAVGCVFK